MADKKGTDDQTSKGTADALPCPWCGELNSGLEALGGDLKAGAVVECDHCGNLLELMSVDEVIRIRCQRHGKMRNNGHLSKE